MTATHTLSERQPFLRTDLSGRNFEKQKQEKWKAGIEVESGTRSGKQKEGKEKRKAGREGTVTVVARDVDHVC